jgi:hypothetical protein
LQGKRERRKQKMKNAQVKDRLQHFIDNCDNSIAKNVVSAALEEIEHLEASYMHHEVIIERQRIQIEDLKDLVQSLYRDKQDIKEEISNGKYDRED